MAMYYCGQYCVDDTEDEIPEGLLEEDSEDSEEQASEEVEEESTATEDLGIAISSYYAHTDEDLSSGVQDSPGRTSDDTVSYSVTDEDGLDAEPSQASNGCAKEQQESSNYTAYSAGAYAPTESYGSHESSSNVMYSPEDVDDEEGNTCYGAAYGPDGSSETTDASAPQQKMPPPLITTKGKSGMLPKIDRAQSLRQVREGIEEEPKVAKKKYPAPPTAAPPVTDPLSIKQECHWNTHFQEALDMEEGKTKWERLAHLARDFVYCSKTYGKIIISEYYLPEEEKTIKSIDAGGIAGGSKYICSNIFFKFALDTDLLEATRKAKGLSEQRLPPLWMYGGTGGVDDCAAMKASKNDMIGLMSCYNSMTPGIYFPLMSVIDYRGFRLTAMSILPITRDTIRYGSADGGKTVHKDSRVLNSKMKQVAESLNLKGHRTGPQKTLIYGPGDIEAHHGKDGKFYMVDFGRVFPPEAPQEKGSRKIFYCLLRPEFVRAYKVPLSSDAFSAWGKINGAIHNREVVEATKYLYEEVIPRFAKELVNGRKKTEQYRITEMLHSNGINCRHLGRVRREVPVECEEIRGLLLNEMLARTMTTVIRQLLRLEMKKMKIASQEPYKQLVLDVLNALLERRANTGSGTFMITPATRRFSVAVAGAGSSDDSQLAWSPATLRNLRMGPPTEKSAMKKRQGLDATKPKPSPPPELRDVTSVAFLTADSFWTRDLKLWVEAKFKFALSPAELDEQYDMRHSVDLNVLIPRICVQAGIKLSKHSMTEFRNSENFKLLNFDLRKVSARVKHLNVIDEAEGNLLFLEATSSDQGRKGLWQATDQKFARAVSSNTNNPDTFVRWGLILMEQMIRLPEILYEPNVENIRVETDSLLSSAKDKFLSALRINDDREEAYFELGNTVIAQAAKMQLTRSEDTIAVSMWLLQEASNHYKTAFLRNQSLYNLVLERAEDLHAQALSYLAVLRSDCISKVPEDAQRERAFLTLLRAFHMMNCAMGVAPLLPDPSTFFLAGLILKDYLIAGGPAMVCRYLYAAAGSLFESAFLTNPSVSDNQVVYYHQKTSAQRTLTRGKNLRALTSSPADVNAHESDSVLIFEKLTGKEFSLSVSCDLDDQEQTCKLRSKIDVVVPKDTPLHMVPVLTEDPSGNYHTTFAINRLYHLLGQTAITTNIDICAFNIYNGIEAPQTPFSETLKVFTFHKGNWVFVLAHSVYHSYLLTHLNIRYPNQDSSIKAPTQIRIFGSNAENPADLTEAVLIKAAELGPEDVPSSKTKQTFLVASFEHLADMNGVLDQRVRMNRPAQYLVVELVPPSSSTKELGISSICLRGHQVMEDRTNLQIKDKRKKSKKSKKSKKKSKSKSKKTRGSSTSQLDSSQDDLRPIKFSRAADRGDRAEHQLLMHQRHRLAKSTVQEKIEAAVSVMPKSKSQDPDLRKVISANKRLKSKRRAWATAHAGSKGVVQWNKRHRSAKANIALGGLTLMVTSKQRFGIGEGNESEQPNICQATVPLQTENSVFQEEEQIGQTESQIDLRASVGHLRHKALCQVLWVDPQSSSAANHAVVESVKQLQPSISVVQVGSLDNASQWLTAQMSSEGSKLKRLLAEGHFRVAVSLDLDLDEILSFVTELEGHLTTVLQSSQPLVPLLLSSTTQKPDAADLMRTSRTDVIQSMDPEVLTGFLAFSDMQAIVETLASKSSIGERRSSNPKASRSATQPDVMALRKSNTLNRSHSETPGLRASRTASPVRNTSPVSAAADLALVIKKAKSQFQYFEVTIVHLEKGGTVMVGLSSPDFPLIGTMPGWKSGSLGYQSSDGSLFCGSSLRPYKFQNRTVQPFGEGDVIGCGYNIQSQQVFWTKNGTYLGAAERGHSKLAFIFDFCLFPTVGFTKACTLKANFGTEQFRFDVAKVYADMEDKGSDGVWKLSKTEKLADLHPYTQDVMADCVAEQKAPLLVMSGIAQYSRSLQILMRAHLQYRREVPATKLLTGVRNMTSIYDTKNSQSRSYRHLDLTDCNDATDIGVAYLCHMAYEPERLNVSLCSSLTDQFFGSILRSKTRSLVSLNLADVNKLTEASANSIVERFVKLHTLRLWQEISSSALERLCSIPTLTNLDFTRCQHLDDVTLIAILKQNRRTLRSLNFTECNDITDKSVTWITRSTAAASLETIIVDFCNNVSQTSILKVIRTCTNLQNLSIACNSGVSNYTDDVAKEFAKRGSIVNMLRLYRCDKITTSAIKALADSCRNIKELDLGHCSTVGDEALLHIATRGTKLVDLDLFNTAVTNSTVLAFVKRHPGLRRLSLQRCTKITAQGFIEMLSFVPNVEVLILRENELDERVILAIARAALPKLTLLDISSSPSPISADVIKFLRKRRPDVMIKLSSVRLVVGRVSNEKNFHQPILETLTQCI